MTLVKLDYTAPDGCRLEYFRTSPGNMMFKIPLLREVTITRREHRFMQRHWQFSEEEDFSAYFQEHYARCVVDAARRVSRLGTFGGGMSSYFTAVIREDGYYAELSTSAEVVEHLLATSVCVNCDQPPDNHASGSCLYRPTRYCTGLQLELCKAKDKIDEGVSAEEFLQYIRRDLLDSRLHCSRHLESVYNARRAWRKAVAVKRHGNIVLQTPLDAHGGPLRSLQGKIEYTQDGLTAALTPDVVAFAQAVCRLANMAELRETLPDEFPPRREHLPPELSPKINIVP